MQKEEVTDVEAAGTDVERESEKKRRKKHADGGGTAKRLPGGWFSALDAGRKRTYYYNPKTGMEHHLIH